jgi:hypothetical protein
MPGGFLGLLAQGLDQAEQKKAKNEQQQQLQNFQALKFGQQSDLNAANIAHLTAETKKMGEPSATDYTITDPGDGSPLLRVNKSTGDAQPLLRSDGTPIMGQKKAPLPGSDEWKQAQRFVAGLKPDPVKNAVAIAQATKGIPTYSDLHPKAASQSVAAPMAAKVGQAGEMIKKAADLLPKMETLDVSLGESAAQDQATHGVGAFGIHIPGTQGIGSAMVNRTPEYAAYQAALTPFVLAAAHAIGGARINDTQIGQIRGSVEIKPGDSKTVRAQKFKNLTDLVNSISGSLPPEAIAEQEGQMDPSAIALLRGYGYKGGTSSPVAHDKPGDINLGAPPKAQPDAAAKPKGHAVSDDEFNALLGKYKK